MEKFFFYPLFLAESFLDKSLQRERKMLVSVIQFFTARDWKLLFWFMVSALKGENVNNMCDV